VPCRRSTGASRSRFASRWGSSGRRVRGECSNCGRRIKGAFIGPEPHPSLFGFSVRVPSVEATGRWRERRGWGGVDARGSEAPPPLAGDRRSAGTTWVTLGPGAEPSLKLRNLVSRAQPARQRRRLSGMRGSSGSHATKRHAGVRARAFHAS
jgi:hypothetical protein